MNVPKTLRKISGAWSIGLLDFGGPGAGIQTKKIYFEMIPQRFDDLV